MFLFCFKPRDQHVYYRGYKNSNTNNNNNNANKIRLTILANHINEAYNMIMKLQFNCDLSSTLS